MLFEETHPTRIQAVLKTAERCNIACTYCYFFNGENATYKGNPPFIKKDTVRNIASFLQDGCKNYNIGSLDIILHGGEPLMQKQKDFDETCSIFKNELSPYTKLSFVMQTNGMLITDRWIELFAKYEVGVGVSMDGPQEYHDVDRLDKKGKGTHVSVTKGLEKLKKAYNDGIMQYPPSLLSVINPDFDGGKVYRYFVDELGIKKMNFLLPDLNHDTIGSNINKMNSFAKYLISVFNEWVKDDNPDIKIRMIEESLLPIILDEEYKQALHPTYVFVINSDGTISVEDTLVTTGDYNKINIGLNVKDIHFKDFVNSKQSQNYYNHLVRMIPDDCKTCCWSRICRGGRPTYRYSSVKGYNNPSVYCDALKSYFTKIIEYMADNGVDRNKIYNALAA